MQAIEDGALHVASLKLNSFGGLSRLRLVCALGVELGIPMRIENYSLAIISRTVAIRFLIPAIFSGYEPPVGSVLLFSRKASAVSRAG